MTTTTEAPVTTRPDPLARFRAAALAVDAPLDASLAYLRELATAGVRDLAGDATDELAYCRALGKVQGSVRALVEHLCREVDADVRAAPPAALAEVVRDVSSCCEGPRCSTRLLPWESAYEEFCSAECRSDHMRESGETRVGA